MSVASADAGRPVLVLVRHGQTSANAEGRLLGRAESPLTDAGRAQVRAVAEALAPLPVRRVISSPLVRATETAAAFGLPVEVDERWIELDYGAYDGVPLGDVPAEVWRTWRSDPTFRPPGGETLAEMAERVAAACSELAASGDGGAVVVVTHVSPVKAAVAWALGVGPEVTWRMFVDVASVSRIALADARRPVLSSFNEVFWR